MNGASAFKKPLRSRGGGCKGEKRDDHDDKGAAILFLLLLRARRGAIHRHHTLLIDSEMRMCAHALIGQPSNANLALQQLLLLQTDENSMSMTTSNRSLNGQNDVEMNFSPIAAKIFVFSFQRW